MKNVQRLALGILLSLSLASATAAGTITGSRAGTITGSKAGTITGSRAGTITGSAPTSAPVDPTVSAIGRVVEILIDVVW